MKTQRNLFIALAIIIATVFSTESAAYNSIESGHMIVKVEKNDAHTLGLRLANLNKKFTKIRITDLNEKVWLTENVTNEYGYAKKLNLNGLPAGEYMLFVENNGQLFVQAFAKSNHDFALFQRPEQQSTDRAVAVLASTYTKGKKGELITRISNPDAMSIGIQIANLDYQETNIQLNGQYSTPMMREKVEGQAGYAKKFNLTGMEPGNYYIVIKAREVTQIQFFSIDENGIQLNDSQVLDPGVSKFKYASK